MEESYIWIAEQSVYNLFTIYSQSPYLAGV